MLTIVTANTERQIDFCIKKLALTSGTPNLGRNVSPLQTAYYEL